MTVYFKEFGDGNEPISANHVRFRRKGFYAGFFKRVLDIAFVLLSLPIAIPVLLITAALTARDGASPFFWQKRVGRDGRVFNMLKLRTMITDADLVMKSYLEDNPEAQKEWDTSQKLRKDPRITKTGRFFRKTSLDELPQLWNVLTGDMSIIGPRPFMESQHSMYSGQLYYSVRPGITGSWQVSDRNECSFAERADFDDAYVRDLSFASDLSILVRTVTVVLRCTGY